MAQSDPDAIELQRKSLERGDTHGAAVPSWDIVTVIGKYVPLTRSGSTYKGLCPFHKETTPSFHVHREKGFFHCFGCGAGGNAIKFVERHLDVPHSQAVTVIATMAAQTILDSMYSERRDPAEDDPDHDRIPQ